MDKRGENKKFSQCAFLPKNRRGQVTIFIIIGLMIVIAGILIYALYPKIKATITEGDKSPQAYIQSCIAEDLKNAVEAISLHGGESNPMFSSTYDEEKIKILCYTEQYCDLCSIQEPQLVPFIQEEIKKDIQSQAEQCFGLMEESYRKKGYVIQKNKEETQVELLPNKINVNFNYSLTLTKGDTKNYNSFIVVLDNNLYELVDTANSMLSWESKGGDVDVTVFMDFNPNLKIEKGLLSDGTKVYSITNRVRKNKFQFASRSLVYSPSGYCS